MINYINLSDVERYSNLVSSEVCHYAHMVSGGWAFFSPMIDAIIGYFQDGKFYGCGVYTFSGWLNLSDESALKVINKPESDKKKLSIRFGRVVDLSNSNVHLIQKAYPYSKEMPNNVMEGWDDISALEHGKTAYVFPKFRESESMQRGYFKMMTDIGNMLGKYDPNIRKEARHSDDYLKMLHDAAKSPKHVLSEQPFELTIDQLGISLKSLAELEAKIKPEEPMDKQRSDYMGDVLERLYLDHPTATTTVLWKALKDDVDSSCGHYDTDLLITDMTVQDIDWHSPSGIDSHMGRARFNNRITDLRKQYKK